MWATGVCYYIFVTGMPVRKLQIRSDSDRWCLDTVGSLPFYADAVTDLFDLITFASPELPTGLDANSKDIITGLLASDVPWRPVS